MTNLLTKAGFWFVVILAGIVTYVFKAFVAENTPLAICALPGLPLLIPYLLGKEEQAAVKTTASRAECEADNVAVQIGLLRKDILARLERLESQEKNSVANAPVGKTESRDALSTALQQIGQRDEVIDRLTSAVSKTNVNMVLIRLTQALEIALSLHKRISNGQSDPIESIQFIVDDLESALAGQGVEHLVIVPGTRIPDLKAGSFTAIAVVEAPSPELQGTVKEVRTRAYFINEENRLRFVAPAKVVLYKA